MGNGQQRQAIEELGHSIQRGRTNEVVQFLDRLAAARSAGSGGDRQTRALAGLDLNATNWNGVTALQLAASYSRADIVRLMMDMPQQNPNLPKIDPNALDTPHRTALHTAASKVASPNCAQCVADLLLRGANPCIASFDGTTPLDVARRAGCTQCVRTIEDKVKLWQGWIDHDERRGMFSLPNWQPRWLVVLRDRHPNTGAMGWSSSVPIACYSCHNVINAPPYVFQVRCQRCGTEIGVTPTLQMALYASRSPTPSSVLPDTAMPVSVYPVPQVPQQISVRALEDASWKTATEALVQGRFRRALQNTPSTDRRFGVSLKLMSGNGTVQIEHSLRVASEADREHLIRIFQNPVKAAYEAWCEQQRSDAAVAAAAAPRPPPPPPTAQAAAPPPPPPPGGQAAQALASQALAAPAADGVRPGKVPDEPPAVAAVVTATVVGAHPAACAAQSSAAADLAPSAPAAAALDADEEENERCVVCLERRADTAVVPCGHLCGCEPCLRGMQGSGGQGAEPAMCPMCRGPMTSLIRIYRN